MSESAETSRFDEAIYLLLNGRRVDEDAKRAIFDYSDGVIDRDALREVLL